MDGSRIVLVYPPLVSMGHLLIYPSLPTLAGSLRAGGFVTKQLNLNSDFIGWYLKSKHISKEMAQVRRRKNALEKRQTLTAAEYQEYTRAQSLNELYAAMRKKGCDINRFVAEFFSAAGIDVPEPAIKSDLVKMMKGKDKGLDLIRSFFRERLGAIDRPTSLFVGISVVMPKQIIPSLILSRMIKRSAWKGVKLFWGGPLMSLIGDDSLKTILKRGDIDGIIKGEGEEAILEIARQLKRDDLLPKSVPNMVFLKANRIMSSGIVPKKHIREYPLPYYDRRNLKKCSGTTSISVLLSRGCTWGKCAFCEYPRLYGRKQLKTPKRAIADISQLIARYPGHKLWLECDMLDAAYIRELCRSIIRERLDFKWLAYMKADPQYSLADLKMIKKAGCMRVAVGVESLGSRILKAINKGYTADQAVEFLRKLGRSGIEAQINMIVDLPGTTYESALGQIDVLRDVLEDAVKRGLKRTVSPNLLRVSKNAPMGMCPKKYGIRLSVKDTKNKKYYINNLPFEDNLWMDPDEKDAILEEYHDLNISLEIARSSHFAAGKRLRPSSVMNCEKGFTLLQKHSFESEDDGGIHRRTSEQYIRLYNMQNNLSMMIPEPRTVKWILNNLPMKLSDLEAAYRKTAGGSGRAGQETLVGILESLMSIDVVHMT
jgi:hypothetical protein